MSRGLGLNQEKLLFLLSTGLALGLSRSPKFHCRVISGFPEAWRELNERQTREAIKGLYRSKFVDEVENKDGTVTITINESGKKVSLRYDLEQLRIGKPSKWDRKWRMVIFDIPERLRRSRDALRFHLQELGFFKYQQSAFVHPFPCKKILDFLIEYHDLRPYVRYVVAESLDNELHLKSHFKLK